MSPARILRAASFRLAALYVLLFTVSTIVLAVAVFWMTHQALNQQLKTRVQSELHNLVKEFASGGLHRMINDAVEDNSGPGALDYLIQSPQGDRLAGEIPAVGARRGWLRLTVTRRRGATPLLAYAAELPGGVVVAVGDSLHRVDEDETTVVRALAASIAVTILLGVAGGAWLSHAFLHRVDAISRTAEAIIDGDLSQRIPLRGAGDDLDRLAETLNRMLDRIGKLLESVRQASNNIAHDLRTPLSRLTQHLEDAASLTCSGVDHQRALDGARSEAAALLGTFAALLRIAEVEAGAQRAAFRAVDLSSVAATVAEAFAPAAEDQEHSLIARIATGVTVYGDRELLTQMLVNLVENALQHTPRGTAVRVLLDKAPRYTVLAVEDDGPGVPTAEHEHVLRRFHRLDRSRTTPGSGLGLSLVAAVAELHGAALQLTDAQPGLRVSLTFETLQGN